MNRAPLPRPGRPSPEAPVAGGRPLFVVIGGSRSQLPFVTAAAALGYETVVFDLSPEAPGARAADRSFTVSARDGAAVRAWCERLAVGRPVAGVLTYSAHPDALAAAAGTARALGLPGCDPGVVAGIADKTWIKKRLSEAGVPTPRWAVASTPAEAAGFCRELGGAVILKPAAGTRGSLGVARANGPDEAARVFPNGAEPVIVEAFCPGREFSVGGVVREGRVHVAVVAEKHPLPTPGSFVMAGFTAGPIARDDPGWRAVDEDLRSTAVAAVQRLDIDFSPFTVDLIAGPGGPCVLEVGVMLDAKVDRLLWHGGTDIYSALCRTALGRDHGDPRLEHAVALRFLFADRPGRLRHLSEKPAPEAAAGGWAVEWERADGDRVAPPRSIADTVGWVACTAPDTGTAARRADALLDGRLFEVEGGRP